MRASDVIAVLESFAPASVQEPWDNSGLQIGSPGQEVHGVLLALDCTPELVREAVARGCDMIVTHHPLLFDGLKRIDEADPVGRTVIEAVRAGIVVYAAHTSADKVPGGVSEVMARRLGLERIEVLAPEAGGVGLGAVGDLPRPLSAAQAVDLVKNRFGLSVLRCSRPVDVPVRRVAVCGGSGASLIPDAIRSGAQLYLCGDISYHRFFTPDGFMVADVGHFESEVEIVEVFCALLRKKIPNFASLISEHIQDSNPIQYL